MINSKFKIVGCYIVFLLYTKTLFAQLLPNYFNNFDTFDTLGWSHYAVAVADDWRIGAPNKSYLGDPLTLPNAWCTKLNYANTPNAKCCLQSPIFDLSDTVQSIALSFYHRTHADCGIGNHFFVDYSIDGGTTWVLLVNSQMPQKNWQTNNGFSGSMYPQIRHSAISVNFLRGNPLVCFRFRFEANSCNNNEGWLLDNFSVRPYYYNLTATAGDTIRNINRHFIQIPLEYNYLFENQFYTYYNVAVQYFLSSDPVLDSSDVFLNSIPMNANNSFAYAVNLDMPQNLHSGLYYVFYNIDKFNILAEGDETDNINHTVLIIDSTYYTNYSNNFDSSGAEWNTALPSNYGDWRVGPPNFFRMEKAHSPPNAVSVKYDTGYRTFESPYIDLSTQTNQALCLWYKSTSSTTPSSLLIRLPLYNNFITSPPQYPALYTIVHRPRNNEWDCYCHRLPALFDTIISTKFQIAATMGESIYGTDYTRFAFDDVYIGAIKSDVECSFKEGNHFTLGSALVDSLHYILWNSGLTALPNTSTRFYWSQDSILDAGDPLLATIAEPVVLDTNFVKRSFEYTKPNQQPGIYYIIYVADADSIVDEMREYNNSGVVKVIQYNAEALPYFNDFESNTLNWYHDASVGMDEWVCTVPNKSLLSAAYSGSKAWVTNDTGTVSLTSRMHLYSPIFDLSTINNPVISFDMKLIPFGNSITSSSQNSSNMSYSIDGGFTWKPLSAQNLSFSRWFNPYVYNVNGGIDYIFIHSLFSSNYLGQLFEPEFVNYNSYNSRDGISPHYYCLDINHLQGFKKIMFRYTYASVDSPQEGVLIDNFRISEADVDLAINSTKNLLVSPFDTYVSSYFNINNNGNHTTPMANLKLYLSGDTILDVGDHLFYNRFIDSIRPNTNHYFTMKCNLNLSLYPHKYMIYQLDDQNLIQESNEFNNVGYFKLCNDSSVSLPYFNDFNLVNIDGWNTFNDSSGVYNDHRFRTHYVNGENTSNLDMGEWFIDQNNSTNSAAEYPISYIESPTFDFSSGNNYNLEFDFTCQGGGFGNFSAGGNLQYSSNGGLTWSEISLYNDPTAINLYPGNSYVAAISMPGWANMQLDKHAKINLGFLTGLGHVKFRFAFKSVFSYNTYWVHGFLMDNFNIYNSLLTNDSEISKGDVKLMNMGSNVFELYTLNESHIQSTDVVDIQGKKINVPITHYYKHSGVIIDLSTVSSGMYFIQLTYGNNKEVFKVVKN